MQVSKWPTDGKRRTGRRASVPATYEQQINKPGDKRPAEEQQQQESQLCRWQ